MIENLTDNTSQDINGVFFGLYGLGPGNKGAAIKTLQFLAMCL